jgi:hypothetical protein
MIKYLLVISLYSPGGDFIQKYAEGPLNTKDACVQRLKEIKKHPNLYGLNHKMQCIHYKGSNVYASIT